MKIDGIPYRSVWVDPDDGWSIRIFDQTKLPWSVDVLRLTEWQDAAQAIRSMQVRGAPLIGAVAAYGVALAMRADPGSLDAVLAALGATRPTAINLRWALDRQRAALHNLPVEARVDAAYAEAAAIADDDAETCRRIGENGLPLLAEIAARKGKRQCADPLQRRLAGHRGLGHRALRRSTRRMTQGWRCMSGWTRPGRATRAPP